MNVNGKQIADDIKNTLSARIAQLPKKPRLDIVYVGKNLLIEEFLRIKRRTGEVIGAETEVYHFPSSVSQKSLIEMVQKIAADKNCDGIIVQLPLPPSFNAEMVLGAIPTEKDIDVLSEKDIELFGNGKLSIAPPVIGAIIEILKQEKISVAGKNAVVLGKGRLVGKPAALWLKRNGAEVIVLDDKTRDIAPFLKTADIIISGAGSPGIIRSEMIREGVLLFDAGASEQAGEIRGDADYACSDKCAIFTPVPGGIGPITIAVLFKNLLTMIAEKTG
jgi:methylenetetrahydrofolate dehydrogenase (NADP+)/methenyltetrahydrofolate cyclohydrolase